MITNKYEHGWMGLCLFRLCAAWTIFLVKHRWLYYLLACTWGIIMTVIGWVISLVLALIKLCSKIKVNFKIYCWVYSISIGPEYWGGFETGLMFLRDHKSSTALDQHEFGHTFQNALFGPFFPLLVGIPSAIRYWYQIIREKHGKTNKAYDAAWFEDAATQCGKYAAEHLSAQKKEIL